MCALTNTTKKSASPKDALPLSFLTPVCGDGWVSYLMQQVDAQDGRGHGIFAEKYP